MSPTTIGDWLRGKRFPQDIGKVLVVVRMVRAAAAARGVAIPGSGPRGCWMRTGGGRRTGRRRSGAPVSSPTRCSMPRPSRCWPGCRRVRVSEADLRLLGVHEAISVPGVPTRSRRSTCRGMSMPPSSVSGPRLAAAAERGGFVLLVGGSSVGKTRCAAEAVKALLPDWWLVHPAGPAEVAALAAGAAVADGGVAG